MFATRRRTSTQVVGGTISCYYSIVQKQPGGGVGIVYKAEDLSQHRFVALNFLSDDDAKDPQDIGASSAGNASKRVQCSWKRHRLARICFFTNSSQRRRGTDQGTAAVAWFEYPLSTLPKLTAVET